MSILGLLSEKFGDLGGGLQIGSTTQHGPNKAVLFLNVVYAVMEHEGTLVLSPTESDCNTHAPAVIQGLQKKILQKIERVLQSTTYKKVKILLVGGSKERYLDRIQIKGI
jgi:hypothetical protein